LLVAWIVPVDEVEDDRRQRDVENRSHPDFGPRPEVVEQVAVTLDRRVEERLDLIHSLCVGAAAGEVDGHIPARVSPHLPGNSLALGEDVLGHPGRLLDGLAERLQGSKWQPYGVPDLLPAGT